jgi:thioredoxin 1
MDKAFNAVIDSSSAVLVDFYATWCEPCNMVVPILNDIEKYFNGRIKLHLVDIDENVELSRSLHILSVPTLVLYKNGKEVWRMRGFDAAPNLIKTISEHLD